MTAILGLVLPSRTTLALDAVTIAPTRLDFDASQAPKNCNDRTTFESLLTVWVLEGVLIPDADRRLLVRIRRSPTGGKLADVTLLDAAGTTVAQDHTPFPSNTECYKVLYQSARVAARLLGAFDKPPPPVPLVCPTCPTCPPPPVPAKPEPCQTCPAPTLPPPRTTVPSPKRRAFIGGGVFLGTGITPVGAVGPQGTIGFALSPNMPRIQFELAGAYASQTLSKSNTTNGLHVDMVPLVGSLCYSRYVFRMCSGLVTTFYMVERTNLVPGNDEFRMTLAANLQLGTEFELAGPFSIRVDVFGRLRFVERTYGETLAKLDELTPFAAGLAAMGVWSFE